MLAWIALLVDQAQAQDRDVYRDALAPGWQDWSWSGTYDFASNFSRSGNGIEAITQAWGGLSLYHPTPFGDKGALSFWMEGDSTVRLIVESVAEGYTAPSIDLAALADIRPGSFTEVVVDLDALGNHAWDRLSWADTSGVGSTFHLDDVVLLQDLPQPTTWTGAEPLGSHHVVLHGGGQANGVTVTVGGVPRAVVAAEPHTDPPRTYLTLDLPLTAGQLVVTTRDGTFTRTLGAVAATIAPSSTHRISPWIYGVAFPPDAAWVSTHGVRVARWGGNAVSCYNPVAGVTNAGVDWYFENRSSNSAESWVDWLRDQGVYTFLTVPSLDWVAKDAGSYSYSVARYGAQQDVDPWKTDAGNGVRLDGTDITWNDPRDAHRPWTPGDAEAWLAGLVAPPSFASVDNELDITGDTHRDVHPDPLGYDELLTRYLDIAAAIRTGQPGATIAAPSSCCWWYYWNSAAGPADKANHGGVDLLPWFLREVAAADAQAGARSLGVLDIHYYPDGVFNDDVSAATRARRLRSTRSLWDPTYTDEGWIGTDQWVSDTQPNINQVQLIPRMKQLLAAEYPGTPLGITEWNWGAEADNSGGLAVADALGIFGRYDLDLATYWTTPDAGTPAAAAFWLYGAPDRPFGANSLPVTFPQPNLLGVYAARDDLCRLTAVVVNKSPTQDVLVNLGLPPGAYTVRHMGGQQEGALQAADLGIDGVVAVPAYGAVFVAEKASPYPLELNVGRIVAGRPVDFTVTGAVPGETVTLARGSGLGPGACFGPLGGLCLDITGNPSVLGTAVADATGRAVITRTPPASLGLREVALQAVARRGPGGADSVKSNPTLELTIP